MSISRNTAVNLVGQAAPVFVSLLSVPLYLHLIGEERYGVILIVWMFLGYFGIFDFGLSRAVAQKVSELCRDQTCARNRVVWTALVLSVALSFLGAIVLYLSAEHGLERCFGAEIKLRGEFISALPWVAMVLPANLLNGTLSGVLQGRERFVELNLIQTLGTIWSQVFPILVAKLWSVELFWLLPAVLSGRVLTGVWLFFKCRTCVPLTWTPVFDCTHVRSLFSYGGWVTVSSVLNPILTTFDRFLISYLGGPSAVTYYSIPSGIVVRTTAIPSALSGVLFPRFAAGEDIARQKLLIQSTRILSAVMTPISIFMILLMEPFLYVWVGADLSKKAALTGAIMAVGAWINGLAFIPHAYLQANGRPKISAFFHLVEVVPYILLLWLGLKYFGVAGAAAAGTLRMAGDALLHYRATNKFGTIRDVIVAPSLMILGSLLIVIFFGMADPVRWVMSAAVAVLSISKSWKELPDVWIQRISGVPAKWGLAWTRK